MDKIKREGEFFSAHNSALTRSVSWAAIPQFQKAMGEELNLLAEAKKLLNGRVNIKALTMACGDMKGEYGFLCKLGATEIDAYDVAEGKKKEFFDHVYNGKVKVDYKIADVNKIELPAGRYQVVFMQHSYHHIEEVDRLAEQIRSALAPDGLFILNDYIGPNFLQRTKAQIEVTRRIWRILPERLRVNPQGKVLDDVHIPPKSSLSPYEAINADKILPALQRNFDLERVSVFAGLLFPLFNGFAKNYEEKDDLFLRSMWEMDKILVEKGVLEPNFIRAIMRPKKNAPV
jgi:SAM-dependent methyltransferase